MSEAMELTDRHLEQIGTYVRRNLGDWIRDMRPPLTVQLDPQYLERMVRIEDELKARRELMQQGFEQMERRFEQVDKRFEQVDKRFEQVDKRFEEMRADTNTRFEESRADMNARFEQVDKRFEEMRADMNTRFEESRADTNARFTQMSAEMKAGFDAARSHTNHWMVAMTIVLGVVGAALAFATVLVG